MDSLISPVLPTAAVLPAASSPLSASAAALLLHNPSNTEAASTSSREADDGSARGGRRHSPRLTDPLLIAREAKKIRQETATLRKQPIQLAASASEESHEQQRERMAEDGQKLEEYTQPLSPPGRRVKPSTSQSERSVEEEEHGDEGTDAERNEDDISSGGQTQREEEDTDSSEPDSELIVEEALAALTSHFSATARSVEHCKRSLRESLRVRLLSASATLVTSYLCLVIIEHEQSSDAMCRGLERVRRDARWPQTRRRCLRVEPQLRPPLLRRRTRCSCRRGRRRPSGH